MPLWPIQQALYSALAGDATLMAKVTGVYDQVPQDGVFPYIVIGDGEAEEWDTDTETGLVSRLDVHAWGRAHGGRKVIKQVQDDINRVLHRTDIAVAGAVTVEGYIEFAESFIDADGETFHGVQRFVLTTDQG